MKDLMNAFKEISFLTLVNKILETKNFCNLTEQVGEKEKVVGQASDLEKSIYTAKDKLIDKFNEISKKMTENNNCSDLCEAEKKRLYDISVIEKIKLEAGISSLNKLFWGLINYRLPIAYKNWDSFGIRTNWQIVGFDINNEEASKLTNDPAEKCIIAQNEVVVLSLLNEIYLKNQTIIEPNELLTENETVVGELNSFEKCIFIIFHLNQIKILEVSQKMKSGEHVDIHHVDVLKRLGQTYNNMLWTSLHYRYNQKLGSFYNMLGIRKGWQVVVFHEDKNNLD